jgi:hypothetical protein
MLCGIAKETGEPAAADGYIDLTGRRPNGGSERAMSGAFPVSVRFGPGPQRAVGTRELRRRGRPVRTVAERAGRGRRGHRTHAPG